MKLFIAATAMLLVAATLNTIIVNRNIKELQSFKVHQSVQLSELRDDLIPIRDTIAEWHKDDVSPSEKEDAILKCAITHGSLSATDCIYRMIDERVTIYDVEFVYRFNELCSIGYGNNDSSCSWLAYHDCLDNKNVDVSNKADTCLNEAIYKGNIIHFNRN